MIRTMLTNDLPMSKLKALFFLEQIQDFRTFDIDIEVCEKKIAFNNIVQISSIPQ